MGVVLNPASGLLELEPDEEFPGSPAVAALPPELRPEPEPEPLYPGAPEDLFGPGGALEPPRPYWEPYVPGPMAPQPEGTPLGAGAAALAGGVSAALGRDIPAAQFPTIGPTSTETRQTEVVTSALPFLSAMPLSPEQRLMEGALTANVGAELFPAGLWAAGQGVKAAAPVVKAGARAAGRAAESVAEELGPAVRRFAEEETGAIRLNPFAGPATPSLGHIPPGGPLQRTLDMLEQEAPRTGPTLSERYRGLQEQLTDRFAGINGLTSAARKELSKQGQSLPMELNAENLAARVPGAGEAGVQRIRDMVSDIRAVLTPGAWPDVELHLNAYLRRMHDLDILAAKGTGRKVVGGMQGPAEVQQALTELQSALGPQRWTQIEDAAKAVVAHNQAGMDRMVRSGLMAQDLADELKRLYPHYTPTRILKHLAEEADSISKRKLSVTSANIKRFTEEGTEAAAARPLDAVMESFVQREALIARNDAARAIAGLAEQQGIGKRIAATRRVATIPGTPPQAIYRRPPGEIPGTISYMDGGKRIVYDVPAWLENEAKLLREVDFGPVLRFLGAMNEIPRKAFVTYNPSWPIANFAIDTFTNLVQGADVREIGKGLVGAIRDIGNNDPVLAEMRRLGAGQAGFFGKTPGDLAKDVKRAGGLAITSKLDMRQFMKNPLRLIGRIAEGQENIGRALEMANRRAAFTTALKAGATPEEAALKARRATVDFSRGGQFVRQANTAFLFLNASVQGTLLPARMLRDSSRARWMVGAAMGAKFANDAYNVQYPEYQDIPRNVRYGSWIVMLPSVERDNQGQPKPNYLAVIPNTREFGLFLGPVTYLTEKLFETAQPEFAQFAATVLPRVQPIEGITSVVPTQLLTTIMENSLNRDFYRNRPIVPPELEGKPAGEQYNEYTSESITALAQKMGISPMQLQHFYYGMTGGGGRAALDTIDPAFTALNPTPEDFRVADLTAQYQAIQAPDVPEEEVGLRRRELLNGLSIEDQEAVLAMTRKEKQQESVPMLSGIARRFAGSQTGELRRLGQEAAERELGVSARQTEERGRALSDFFDQERKDQEAQDKALSDNPGMVKEWREAHKASGIRFEGALRAFGVVFPNAADMQDSEKWREYQTKVYTVADTIPDRRTKGQLLVAGYRAIPLEAIDPLTEDFSTFFQRREEYRASLTEEDRTLLDRELNASRTETEREYAQDQETLRPYWELADKVQQRTPLFKKVMDDWKKAKATGDTQRRAFIESLPAYKDYKRLLDGDDGLRMSLRKSNPEIQRAGKRWYDWKLPK